MNEAKKFEISVESKSPEEIDPRIADSITQEFTKEAGEIGGLDTGEKNESKEGALKRKLTKFCLVMTAFAALTVAAEGKAEARDKYFERLGRDIIGRSIDDSIRGVVRSVEEARRIRMRQKEQIMNDYRRALDRAKNQEEIDFAETKMRKAIEALERYGN